MTRYIGIAHEQGDSWYCFCILLYNKMLKISLWTPRIKMPKYYFYDQEAFGHCVNIQEITTFGWIFGISINK